MFLSVVNQCNEIILDGDPICNNFVDYIVVRHLFNRDMIECFPVAVMNFIKIPFFGNTRFYIKFVGLEPESKKGFSDKAVHPSG